MSKSVITNASMSVAVQKFCPAFSKAGAKPHKSSLAGPPAAEIKGSTDVKVCNHKRKYERSRSEVLPRFFKSGSEAAQKFFGRSGRHRKKGKYRCQSL